MSVPYLVFSRENIEANLHTVADKKFSLFGETSSMKTFQRLLVLGLFVCGACIMGCGTETTAPAPATSDSTSDTGSTESNDSAEEGSGTSESVPVAPATDEAGGEFQLVSVKVPNMT